MKINQPCLKVAFLLTLSFFTLFANGALSRYSAHAAAEREFTVAAPTEARRLQLPQNYGQLPLSFESNQGQSGARVQFLARGQGYTLFLTGAEAVLRTPLKTGETPPEPFSADAEAARRFSNFTLKLAGANPAPRAVGLNELPGRSHYFLGTEARRWRTDVPQYGRVKYEAVYPGIDLVWYGQQQQLEYDFIVAPGADPQQIKLDFAAAQSVRLARNGDLLLATEGGEVRQRAPLVYQERAGVRRTLRGRYRMLGRKQIGFTLGAYDKRLPLVIDPVLVYTRLVSGLSTDIATGVAVDAQGNAYLTGYTASADFPLVSPVQGTKGDTGFDAFILKLNPAGTTVVYATYLGGNSTEQANAIALDGQGNAYVSGFTFSTNFPVTSGALLVSNPGISSGFLTKLNAAGSALAYSTYLGGNGSNNLSSVAVDGGGNAYVSGSSDASDYPVAGLTNVRGGAAVYKRTDGATSWSASANGLGRSVVNTLALAPSDQKVLYAGTNFGVFKSTDGGATWRVTDPNNTGVSRNTIRQIVVDPVNAMTLYVLTQLAVYKSTDGGDTYALKITGVTGFVYNSLALAATEAQTLYVGTDRGVFKTVDGGDSWQAVNTGLSTNPNVPPSIQAVAVDPATAMIAYAYTSGFGVGMFKTVNGGASWAPASNGLGSLTARGIFINPVTPPTLYVTSSSFATSNPHTIYKSTDGGANWSFSDNGFSAVTNGQLFPLFPAAFALDPANPNTLYAASNLGIYRSTDGGANWAVSDGTGLNNTAFTALAVDKSTPATVFVGVNSGTDAFAAKINPDGAALGYFKLFAGVDNDLALDVAVDAAGNAYLSGSTNSPNFPTLNPLQAQKGTGPDAFVLKLGADGGTIYATFLGGNGTDIGNSLAVSAAGNVFVAGTTFSTNFPTVNPARPKPEGFSNEVFAAKLKADGSGLDYSTYLGGTSTELVAGIAVDAAGNAHIVGTTQSLDFPNVAAVQPTFGGAVDAFVVKLSAAGSTLLYATFLGGNNTDQAFGIALDASGNAYVAGLTASFNFPGSPQLQPRGSEAFLVKLGLQADLALRKDDARDPVQVNNDLTYTLTVNNNGPDTASDIVVTDTLPAGVTFVSASSGCSGTSTITCNIAEIAPNAAAAVTITVRPTTAGAAITNRATVTSATTDPQPNNNAAQQETRVVTLPSLAGRITQASGAGVGGVTVNLTGARTATTTTDNDGKYQFAELPAGGNYTVTPTRAGFAFRALSQSFNNLTLDGTANFNAIACLFTIAPRNQAFPAVGGTGSIAITAPDTQCTWTARSQVPWITLTSPAAGIGNGAITFTVAPTVSARSGAIIVGGNSFTVTQEFNACPNADFLAPQTFALRNVFARSGVPRFVVRDFNGDRRADLAFITEDTTAPNLHRVALALGNDSGGFAAQVNLTAGNSGEFFQWLTADDFNNDGKLDLAVAASVAATGRVLILLGDGAGAFAAPAIYAVNTGLGQLVAGDLNGDNRRDLVIASPNTSNQGRVAVLLNTAAGTFEAAKLVDFNQINSAASLALGDFNGDGRLDLAAVNSFNRGALLLGDGAGNLGNVTTFQIGSNVETALAADFNGDRRADLVLGGAGVVSLHSGTSAGLGAAINYPVGSNPRSLAADDFNGDGRLDVVVSGSGVLLGNGNGFDPPVNYFDGTINSSSGTGTAVATGDFNRDGAPDVFSLGLIGSFDPLTTALSAAIGLSVQINDGNGRLLAPRGFPFLSGGFGNSNPAEPALGDLNGDGLADLAVAYSTERVAVMFGNGRGEFGAPTAYPVGTVPKNITLADFNNDGRLDIGVANQNSASVTLLINNGRGEFLLGVQIPTAANGRALGVSDFNNDGNVDLVVKGAGRNLTLLLGDGRANFTPAAAGIVTEFDNAVVKTADFNGDTNADLLLYNTDLSSSNCSFGSDRYAILLGDGRGGFRTLPAVTLSQRPDFLRPGDLNGDGRADLFFASGCNGVNGFYVLLANADGTLAAPVRYDVTGANPRSAVAGDFNGDGRPDVAVANQNSGNISIFIGKGDGTFNTATNLPLAAAPQLLAAGDLNEDGVADLVATREFANTAAVVLNRASCVAAGGLVTASAASFSQHKVAADSIATAFGANLATQTAAATTVPLPTTLGGVSVRIRDSGGTERDAPLFFVSSGQINYLIPAPTPLGTAVVTVVRGGVTAATGTLQVVRTAPGLFSANASGLGVAAAVVLRVRGGVQTFEPVARFEAAQNRFVAVPIDLGEATDQVFLLLFGTGLRNRSSLANTSASIGGLPLDVAFAGAQGGFAGLDQINLRLPRTLAGRGEAEVVLTADGRASNGVRVNIR